MHSDHRALHSFPTRRSSDLMQQRIADFYDAILVYGHRAVFDPLAAYEFPESVESRTHFCGYVAKDRKSTRLNSSHTVISYAVFCLKKKKMTIFLLTTTRKMA